MGKGKYQTVGYHYRVAYHAGLSRGPIDAFLEFRAADKVAWDGTAPGYTVPPGAGEIVPGAGIPGTGPMLHSGRIGIAEPDLFGGVKDQGGILTTASVMFGEPDQEPSEYLQQVFGPQVAAWRGLATFVFEGGRYGAMNPMPQKPSYKIRKIKKGWDGGDCWYPEKAEIWVVLEDVFIHDLAFPATSAAVGPYAGVTIDSGFTAGDVLIVSKTVGMTYRAWSRWSSDSDPNANGRPWANDFWVTDGNDNTTHHWTESRGTIDEAEAAVIDRYVTLSGSNSYTFWLSDTPVNDNRGGLSLKVWKGGLIAMNPAHALYYVRTDSEKGREPRDNINDDSLRAAADQLYSEGFGLCWHYDPATDTPDEFEQRICRIIGGSFERSLVNGQWYLDLARGDYALDELPIIGDDDILDFKELPSSLDRAVNSISVRYFDPEKKETIITPAVRALGLVRQFGEIHETLDFPEIPTASLAIRVAEREVRARVTPTRTFDITTTPRLKALRRNQYVRLQSAKRRIADMVCILGEKQNGTLKSGALRLKITQDVYSLPDSSYIEVEEGVDTRPPQVPVPIEHARVFEAPWVDVCANLQRAELEALPDHVGYLLGVAARPAHGLDYALFVEPEGGEYAPVASAEWCPTATVVDAFPREHGPTEVGLVNGQFLERATVGMAVLWDDEWCRLDAIDVEAMTATLARGCADTVPWPHAAGSRLWFLGNDVAADVTEYTDGETIAAKVLPSTGSRQLPLDAAAPMALDFEGRQARPYPPAGVELNGVAYPTTVIGDVEITAAHRDRLLQADQLVDQTAADIGPEPGTTYIVRNVNAATDVETYYADGVAAFPHVVPVGNLVAMNRLEVYSVRDGLESWQRVAVQFSVGAVLMAEDGSSITAEDGEPIVME